MDRLRIATIWLGGCSGCHMSFLDLDEFLIDLPASVDLVYSPLMDIKEYPGNVDVCLAEGAVCNEDHLEMLHKVRSRTKVLIAFGDCAVTGNVPAIRNQLGLSNRESVLQRAYVEGARPFAGIPSEPGVVPPLLARVVPLHEVVHVDGYMPGCPPSAEQIKSVLDRLLNGGLPALQGIQIKFG